MRTLAALIAILLASSCGTSEPEPRVVLERADRDGYWRATYSLVSGTGELYFQRPAAFYRERVWEIVTPGWSLGRSRDRQTLVAEAGADHGTVVVEFPVYTEFLPKEYEFFQSYSDGSVAIYSGHLYVADSPGEEAEPLRRIELVPGIDERMVVQGRVLEGRTVWEDPHGDGTYLYFGEIEPLETEAMIAILDPGAPVWLTEELQKLLPRMFALFTERFGEPLPWKPVVLFNFEDVEVDGISSGGGTLTALVQMSAVGLAWHQASRENAEQLLYLVAHEAAHFWNGQLHGYDEMADSWMHEGSADAFADLVLLRSGTIDEQRLAERRTEALNRCALGLRDGSLRSSLERQQFRNYYACGNLIAIWSVAKVARTSDLDRLFDVWRAVFERADPEDGNYDRDAYFEALSALGADAGTIDALRTFIDAEHDDPSAALVELMAFAGIRLVELDRPLPEMRRDRANNALRHLMGDACGGRYSIRTEGRRLHTAAMEDCAPFSEALRVVAIEGHAFGPAGDLAAQAVAEICARGGNVVLNLEDGGEHRVPCNTAAPREPAPLAFPRV